MSVTRRLTDPLVTGGLPWWRKAMLPFDLETTGVSVYADRIVTGYVGKLLPQEGGPWDVVTDVSMVINPGVPIPPEASAVHGVTDRQAQQFGMTPVHGVDTLAEAVARGLLAGFPVVGYNVSYDLSMLYWECRRHDLPTVGERCGTPDWNIGPIVDGYVLDKAADPYRKGSRKLTAAAEHYRVKLEGAHDAAFDALAAARVVYRIASTYPQIGDAALDDLHEQQVAWKAEQASGLQRHLRRNNPGALVDTCWPVCTNEQHREG